MKTADFSYSLPEDRIAQEPAESRDQSRMMVVHRSEGTIECLRFTDFPGYLGGGDVLVVNDSRVIPARLEGRKASGGRVELLLLEQQEVSNCWITLLRPARRVSPGMDLYFRDNARARVLERLDEKRWILQFILEEEFDDFLAREGEAPLPPYIKRDRSRKQPPEDLKRYQTVYASAPGSVAAPTAGLHFSEAVLGELKQRNVAIAPITLHVGPGTFMPLEAENVEDHVMERERYSIPEESALTINTARRVVAVGTTSVRTMESSAGVDGKVRPGAGDTDLFIYPGFQFRATGALLTNFHLPASSLFLLVCAFGGTDLMKRAYQRAIDEGFRFYSYGDCMLIL